MTKAVPWESVPGLKIKGYDKPQPGWVKPGMYIVSAVFIAFGIWKPFPIAVVFGVLYLLSLMMVKSTAFTSRGLEIFFDMRFSTHYDSWTWNDVFSLTYEEVTKYPDKTLIYVTIGDRTKKIYVNKDDKKPLLDMGITCNPKLRIYSAAETRKKASDSRQAAEKARKRKKK